MLKILLTDEDVSVKLTAKDGRDVTACTGVSAELDRSEAARLTPDELVQMYLGPAARAIQPACRELFPPPPPSMTPDART